MVRGRRASWGAAAGSGRPRDRKRSRRAIGAHGALQGRRGRRLPFLYELFESQGQGPRSEPPRGVGLLLVGGEASGASLGPGAPAAAGSIRRLLPQPSPRCPAFGACLPAEPGRALARGAGEQGARPGAAIPRRGPAAGRLGRLRASTALARVTGEPRGPPARPHPLLAPRGRWL